jgi:hypothetical protein
MKVKMKMKVKASAVTEGRGERHVVDEVSPGQPEPVVLHAGKVCHSRVSSQPFTNAGMITLVGCGMMRSWQ